MLEVIALNATLCKFGQGGGGTQYESDHSIANLIEGRLLKAVV